MIHMKSQDLFSLKNKKKMQNVSAVVAIGALRVNLQHLALCVNIERRKYCQFVIYWTFSKSGKD